MDYFEPKHKPIRGMNTLKAVRGWDLVGGSALFDIDTGAISSSEPLPIGYEPGLKRGPEWLMRALEGKE